MTTVLIPERLTELPARVNLLTSRQADKDQAEKWGESHNAFFVYFWPPTKTAYLPVTEGNFKKGANNG